MLYRLCIKFKSKDNNEIKKIKRIHTEKSIGGKRMITNIESNKRNNASSNNNKNNSINNLSRNNNKISTRP